MHQDPDEPGRPGQHLLDDIEKELAVIKSAFPGGSAPPAARPAPENAGARQAGPRMIDTRAINLSAEDLRRTKQAQINRKTLQERLAEVKVPD